MNMSVGVQPRASEGRSEESMERGSATEPEPTGVGVAGSCSVPASGVAFLS